jgi:hypothetical protein
VNLDAFAAVEGSLHANNISVVKGPGRSTGKKTTKLFGSICPWMSQDKFHHVRTETSESVSLGFVVPNSYPIFDLVHRPTMSSGIPMGMILP